jgi:hypothetical protein
VVPDLAIGWSWDEANTALKRSPRMAMMRSLFT